jgi:putative acetyltransferase
MILVRPARLDDLDTLATIAAISFRFAFAGIVPAETLAARDPPFFRERFELSWRRMQVAMRDERIAGYSQVSDAHIDLLFVDPELHGGGVGYALLRQAEQDGAATLECFSANAQARRFYDRAGWSVIRHYERAFAGIPAQFVLYARNSRP